MIEPRRSFPRRETRLVIVDTERWKVFDRIDLEGDFSFDAISPDGSILYLIHYVDRRDPSRYEVRAYDTVPGELRPEPTVDRHQAPGVMRGFPLTRATSPDGIWEYTLYDGGGETPFVHALNTADATSVCIDLPQLEESPDLWHTRLEPSEGDGTITAVSGRRSKPRAMIETGSWLVSDPRAAAASADGGSTRSFCRRSPRHAATGQAQAPSLGIQLARRGGLGQRDRWNDQLAPHDAVLDQ